MEEEFYQNSSWSKMEKEFFYFHLHQIPDGDKGFYLNEKAERLLSTRRKVALKGVLILTDDAIFGYPNKGEMERAYTLRAKASELLQKANQAEECYRQALGWAGMNQGGALDATCNLITFYLRHHRKKYYDEVLEMVENVELDIYRKVSHDFVALSAKAIIARHRGHKLRQTANEALKLVKLRHAMDNDKSSVVDLQYHGFMIDELLKIVR